MARAGYNLRHLSAFLTLLLAALFTAPLSAADSYGDRQGRHLLTLDSGHGAATLTSKLSVRDLPRQDETGTDGGGDTLSLLPRAHRLVAPERIVPAGTPKPVPAALVPGDAYHARAPPTL